MHQREAQGPTPLKTAAKLCRRHNTTIADRAGYLGQSRADDMWRLAVVVKCPLELVHASVLVERFCVLRDRPCFLFSPLSTVWLPSCLLTASTFRQQCRSVTPVHNMCKVNRELARGKHLMNVQNRCILIEQLIIRCRWHPLQLELILRLMLPKPCSRNT